MAAQTERRRQLRPGGVKTSAYHKSSEGEVLERAVRLGSVEEIARATCAAFRCHQGAIPDRMRKACTLARRQLLLTKRLSRQEEEAFWLTVALAPDGSDDSFWEGAQQTVRCCYLPRYLDKVVDYCVASSHGRARGILRLACHNRWLSDDSKAAVARLGLEKRDYGLLAGVASRDEVCRELSRLARSATPVDDLEGLATAVCVARPRLVFAHWPDLVQKLIERHAFEALAKVLRAPGQKVVDRARSSRLSATVHSVAAVAFAAAQESHAFDVIAALCELDLCVELSDEMLARMLLARAWRPLRSVFEKRLVSRRRIDVDRLVSAATKDDDALETLVAAAELKPLTAAQRSLIEFRCLNGHTSLAALKCISLLSPPVAEQCVLQGLSMSCAKTVAAAAHAASLLAIFSHEVLLSLATVVKCSADPEAIAAACRALGVAALDQSVDDGALADSFAPIIAASTASSHKVLAQVAFALGNAANRVRDVFPAAMRLAEHTSAKVAAGALRAAARSCSPPDAPQLAALCRRYVNDSALANNKVRRNACAALGVLLPMLRAELRAEALHSLFSYLGSRSVRDNDDRKALAQAADAALPCLDDLDDTQLATAFACVLRLLVRVDKEGPFPGTNDTPEVRQRAHLFDTLATLGIGLLTRASQTALSHLDHDDLSCHLDFLYVWLTTTVNQPDLPDLLDKIAATYIPAEASVSGHSAKLDTLERFVARARFLRRRRHQLDEDDEEL